MGDNMNKTSDEELSETQKELLQELELKFKDRFTDADEEFMKICNATVVPPIIDPWNRFSKDRRNNKRNYDNSDHYSHHQYDRKRPRY